MKNFLVTIVVPIYNSRDYLKLCLDSLIHQSYIDLEIILVNDGSSDNSLDICNEYAKFDKRIKVINIPNGGVSNARNIGINNARGKYIRFVDSDDELPLNSVEINIKYLSKNNSSLVIFGYDVLYEYKKIIYEKREYNSNFISFNSIEFFKNLIEYDAHKLINSPCNKIYELDIIKNNKIEFDKNLKYGEDLKFNFEYFKNLNNKNIVTIIPENGYNYYIRKKNVSLSRNVKNYDLNTIKEIYQIKLDFFYNKNITDISELKLSFFRDIISYYYIVSTNYSYKKFKQLFDKKYQIEEYELSKNEIKEVPLFYKIGWYFSKKNTFILYLYLKIADFIRKQKETIVTVLKMLKAK